MISIIITSYKEPKTIGKAIESLVKSSIEDYELIVTAPDNETLDIAKQYIKENKKIKILKDEGKGKPSALNLAVSKAKGDILVFTDGDVYVGDKALNYLLEPLKNKKIGAVTGNPVSLNHKKNLLGYWAYTLTKTADKRRKKAEKSNRGFFCSGYLFAIRKELIPKLPEELLSEDGFISNNVYKNNFKIAYAEKSKVFIKYPTTFEDWVIQKKRSAGGYTQIKKMTGINIRSFRKESFGALGLFEFVSNPRELLWLFALFFSRIYLWFLIKKDISIKKKSHKEIWKRVESTK